MSEPGVVAVAATCRRPREVARLLDSLAASAVRLRGAVIVDNADDPDTAAVIARPRSLDCRRLAPGSNLGCGAGLALAESDALQAFGSSLSHLWILDDDAVVAPDALGLLLREMERSRVNAAYPGVTDETGRLGWPPGLLDRAKLMFAVRRRPTPAEFLARYGEGSFPFSWSPGVALLVTREAVERLGGHRGDYWVRGEDLEFSLRLTHGRWGVFVPAARVRHLPPPPAGEASREAEYRKHGAMLQNVAYTALHLPHGRRLARTIPGNWLRFLRTWGLSPRVLADAWRAFFLGAVRAKPAGVARYFQT